MLPQLLPMLAVSATPFDAPEYSFEVKWDGIRALAAVEATAWRLWGRKRADYTARYPELDGLRRLSAGTLLDGELVALSSSIVMRSSAAAAVFLRSQAEAQSGIAAHAAQDGPALTVQGANIPTGAGAACARAGRRADAIDF
jgi:ATP-dependent DNA ligase